MYLIPPKLIQNLKQNLSQIAATFNAAFRLPFSAFGFFSYVGGRHDATRAELEFRNEKSKQTSRDCRNDESDAEVVYPVDTRSYNGTHVANGLCNRELSWNVAPDIRSL